MTVLAGFARPNSQSRLAQWMPGVFAWLLGFALMFGPSGAFAAEIANVRALSFIGQPLKAEVELATMPAEEAQNLRVRLAVPDTYRQGNIRRNPVLNSMRIQLQQQGQRNVIQLQTSDPVLEGYLHVYLEFNDGKNNSVRVLTVWLDADPERPIAEYPQAPVVDQLDAELAMAEPAHVTHAASATAHDAPQSNSPTHRAAAIERRASGNLPHSLPATTPSKNLHPRPVASKPTASKQQCKPNRQENLRCELNAIENERLAAEIEVLDHKVGILRRVILAEDQPASVAKPAPAATSSLAAPAPAPINLKLKKLAQSAIPWRIIGISAAVFVAVALLSFLLLMLKAKLQKRVKKTKTPASKGTTTGTEGGATEPKVVEQAQTSDAGTAEVPPQADAGTEADTAAPAQPEAPGKGKKFAFKAWLQHSVAKIRAPFGKMGQKLAQLPAKFKSMLKFKRKQVASEEVKAEVKTEPES